MKEDTIFFVEDSAACRLIYGWMTKKIDKGEFGWWRIEKKNWKDVRLIFVVNWRRSLQKRGMGPMLEGEEEKNRSCGSLYFDQWCPFINGLIVISHILESCRIN